MTDICERRENATDPKAATALKTIPPPDPRNSIDTRHNPRRRNRSNRFHVKPGWCSEFRARCEQQGRLREQIKSLAPPAPEPGGNERTYVLPRLPITPPLPPSIRVARSMRPPATRSRSMMKMSRTVADRHVTANPPYIRQEWLSPIKPYLQSRYAAYHGMADLYVYFYELGLNLLKPGGRLSYVVTNKWMKAGYGEPLRKFFAERGWSSRSSTSATPSRSSRTPTSSRRSSWFAGRMTGPSPIRPSLRNSQGTVASR